MSFLPPYNGDVEIDPEEDVDDKDGDERLLNVGDASCSGELPPEDVTRKNDATA